MGKSKRRAGERKIVKNYCAKITAEDALYKLVKLYLEKKGYRS